MGVFNKKIAENIVISAKITNGLSLFSSYYIIKSGLSGASKFRDDLDLAVVL